jgi:hypothetical protein
VPRKQAATHVHKIWKFSDLADDAFGSQKRSLAEMAHAKRGHISCGDKFSLLLAAHAGASYVLIFYAKLAPLIMQAPRGMAVKKPCR